MKHCSFPNSTDWVWLRNYNTIDDFFNNKKPINDYMFGGAFLLAVHGGGMDAMLKDNATMRAPMVTVAVLLVESPELHYEMRVYDGNGTYSDVTGAFDLPKPDPKHIIPAIKLTIDF